MRVTIELSENDLKDIVQMTGEKRKGPAVRKFLIEALMLYRRREFSKKLLTGDISANVRLTKHPRDLDVWTCQR